MSAARSGVSVVVLAALLASCGGGGSGGSVSQPGTSTAPAPTPSPTPTPTPTSAACTLRAREDWLLAAMREWYLFPETLPATLDPTPYSNASDYLDALTATARSQGRDRYFTYLTSIAQENAYYSSGSSAGYGFRLATDGGTGIWVIESYEGTSALQAGIDRGTQILAIGTSSSNLRTVSDIINSQGLDGVTAALGPDTAGTTRTLRVQDLNGVTRTVSVTKTDFTLAPVSSRYGAQILTDPVSGGRVGYVNLRTFISTAEPALRSAFSNFKAQGITNVIVDLRYNGGGLVSIAQLFGDLLGGARTTSDVLNYTAFRPEKSAYDEVRYFAPQPESIAPARIAFIGTRGTASASELVINTQIPYLHANAALVGTNTYGKPVGQIALDKPECDDRLRVIAFATQNANHQGNYFSGLANTVEASCSAIDDISYPLGDPRESSIRAALDFVAGRSCNRISSTASLSVESVGTRRERLLLSPARPSPVQRDVPGSF